MLTHTRGSYYAMHRFSARFLPEEGSMPYQLQKFSLQVNLMYIVYVKSLGRDTR